MSRSHFTVTCQQCRAAFSTPFPQESALLRCPGCAREAPGREFDYARMAHIGQGKATEAGDLLFAESKSTAFERRGEWILFKCPHCQWAMRIREDLSATSLVDCGRCGLEILPPDPEAGTPATLTPAGALRLGRAGAMAPPLTRTGEGGEEVAPRAAVDRRRTDPPMGALEPKREDPWRPDAGGRVPDPAFRESVREATIRESREGDGLIRQARIFRGAMIAGIAVLAVLTLVLRFHDSGRGEPPPADAESSVAASMAPPPPPDSLRARAEALAREAAAREDWPSLLPLVRHRDRVEPIMADYYSRHPYVPLRLVDFDAPVSFGSKGRRYLQLGALTAEGERRVVGFEEPEGGALAFDWEVYANVAADQWAVFRDERPSEGRALRFAFVLASVADRFFEDAGVPREEGVAVRIWFREREDALVAVFPKDSLGGVMIDRVGSWDLGKLVIGELAFPPGSGLPDRVDFKHLLQERWLITDDEADPLF